MPKPYQPKVTHGSKGPYGRRFNPDCNQIVEGTVQGPTASEVADEQMEKWARKQLNERIYKRALEAQRRNQRG